MTAPDYLELARNDLGYYLALVHRTDMDARDGNAVPYPHHARMIAALENDALGNTVIVEPRDSAKTTIIQAYMEWWIGRQSLVGGNDWANRTRIIYFRTRAEAAEEVSFAMKQHIEGDIYQAIFPKVKPNTLKWANDAWRVKGCTGKDPTMRALGIGASAIGSRAERIVFDDPAGEENMRTEHQREGLRHWIARTAMPMLVPMNGRAFMPNTRWHWRDPTAWAESQGWHEVYEKALAKNDEGEWVSYWPERYSVSLLMEMRDRDPKTFAQMYQNEVYPEEGLLFLREWFEQRFDAAPETVLFTIDSWDTASAEGRNRSYSAVVSAAVTPDYHIYVFFSERDQLVYWALRDQFVRIHEMTRADITLVEAKSSGQALLHDSFFHDKLRLTPWAPAGERGAKATKEQQAQWVTKFCSEGRVHLASEWYCRRSIGRDWTGGFLADVVRYDGKQSEGADTVDALAQLISYVEVHRQQHERLLIEPQQMEWGRGRGRKVLL